MKKIIFLAVLSAAAACSQIVTAQTNDGESCRTLCKQEYDRCMIAVDPQMNADDMALSECETAYSDCISRCVTYDD